MSLRDRLGEWQEMEVEESATVNTRGQGSLRPDFHKVGSVKEKHVSPWSTKFRGRFFVGHGLECTIHIISPFVYYI